MKSFSFPNIILISLLFFSCNSKNEIIELKDLMETTHQIVFYKDNIIRVLKPKIEGECCSRIQLLNKKLELIDEIECLEPYPSIKIEYDNIIICYSIFKSDEHAFIGGYEYYKDKFKMLGNYKLSYKLQYIFTTTLGVDTWIDSIQHNGHIVAFYRFGHIVAERSIQELFYENHYFYSVRLHDSVREILYFKPDNNEVYVGFFIHLITPIDTQTRSVLDKF